MIALFRKEIVHFFGSLTGYLVVISFLLVSGLFLWVFPGNYNIIDNGYATLGSFFSLAPWLYLFLVPAVTMRLFSEEKRTGTMETLLTRPLSDFSLVTGKFLAGLVLVILSLIPTILYFISVYRLGNPVGNIDTGAAWGSFFGLFCLAAIYVAIGLFSSSLTDNQIVSFVIAMIISFIFFLGFEIIGDTGIPYSLEKALTWLSISEHYRSVSRGVIDLRDVIYYAGMTSVFLWMATLSVRKARLTVYNIRKNLILIISVIIILFFLSDYFVFRIDLTAEKRYSLSGVTKELAGKIEKPIEIELFLTGELPPGFRKLQQEIIEKVNDINLYASQPFRLKVTDPYKSVSPDKRTRFFEGLADSGVKPTDLRQTTDAGVTTRLIFPGAIVTQGSRKIAVNFLRNRTGLNAEMNLNNSVESIEFELTDAIRKLQIDRKPVLAFLEGQGELNKYEVQDLSASLLGEYEIVRVTIEELAVNYDKISCLIIAGPVSPFQESEKLIIDQYIMSGGKSIWLINPVQVSIDSLTNGHSTLAFPHDLNLNDQLFRYGIRLNYDLLQDVVCSELPVNTALQGNSPNFSPQPWYYYPLLTPSPLHPISRNIDLVQAEFVSSCDTVSGGGKIRKTVILSSSPYARKVRTPAAVSLRNIDNPPARELFNQQFIPVGILLEGTFISNFRNRMTDEFNPLKINIIPDSKHTGMIVISTGSIIANKVRFSGDKPSFLPLGYDRVTQQTYGNKEFLINAIQYLHDNNGIMQLRNQTVKLRLLDKVRLREERVFWQLLNVVLPVLVTLLTGLGYQFLRNFKFARA